MCDIILATISHQLLLLSSVYFKWTTHTYIILQINYIDFVDSVVSKCTSLHTVAIDDNHNGFMAALSRLKHKMKYDLIWCTYNTIYLLYTRPFRRSIERNGHLARPTQVPSQVRRKFILSVSPILFLNWPDGRSTIKSDRSYLVGKLYVIPYVKHLIYSNANRMIG